MPGTTTCVAIPYPLDTDPINVAADMAAMAQRLDTLICAIGGNPIGSFTPWWDNGGPAPQGYLRCDGTAFDPLAYPDLTVYLGSSVTPDLRNRFLRGTGGNFPGNAQIGGWDDAVNVTHSHAQAQHNHTIAHTHNIQHYHDMSHTHNGGTAGASARHSHNSGGGHTEPLWRDGAYNTGYGIDQVFRGLAVTWGALGGDAPDHAHSFSVGFSGTTAWSAIADSGGPSTTVSGLSAAVQTGDQGGVATNRNLPPFFNVTWLIRATQDVV